MAYVQGSLGEKISKTMDDAAALFKQGDYQQSIDMFARAWDLLPDSKYSYDESYLIVWRILIVALKANDTAVMKRWVKHIFLADPERADCGEREMWGARVAMACGDKEKAFQNPNDTFPTIYRVDRLKSIKVLNEHFAVPYSDRFEEGEFRKRIQFMYGGRLQKVKFRYSGADIDAVLDRTDLRGERRRVYSVGRSIRLRD